MGADSEDRYSRQIRFAQWGEEGQRRLRTAKVGIVGCGALGSFQAGALARAGVGSLTLVDRDYVELSNLQRQWLYDEQDVADVLPKALSAARHLHKINSECHVLPEVADLNPGNVDDLLSGLDLILDGTDNFETRYLINDFAVREHVPWVYGAAVGSYGIAMEIEPGTTSCLACVYPHPPAGAQPTCETAGVLNTVTSMVAAHQVALAMRRLARPENPPKPRISTYDVWTGEVRQITQPPRDPECRACGKRNFSYLESHSQAAVSLCGRNAVQIHETHRPVDLQKLGRSLGAFGQVRVSDFALRFLFEKFEMMIFPDGRAIVKGTTDPGVARSLYARYVGI